MSTGAEGPGYRAYEQPVEEPSLGELFSTLTSDLGDLVRSEMELARVEIREEAGKAGKAAGMLGGAAWSRTSGSPCWPRRPPGAWPRWSTPGGRSSSWAW